ncbi:CPBP family glutamic-type intramembrane protease [Pigmentiphaga sp.]|uniref:CPBP family glutamic-type intramembrane protease n=1 Tax=Pigmentiphaga sp. TaxID=1977564 RepID=UPI0025FD5B91|nr:CPBP family glutamic-type intramembrane protease [Pigmentiphaga sp.]
MPDMRGPRSSLNAASAGERPRFREEFADFLAFVKRPRLAPRMRRGAYSYRRLCQGKPRYASLEWLGGAAAPRFFCWLLVLWGINLLLLGPLAASVATASGAQRRLDVLHLSWFHVVVWAPVIEEMVFRFGLRRPAAAVWLLPVMIAAMLMRPSFAAAVSVALACGGIAGVLAWRRYRWPRRWLRRYRNAFPVIFHVATLAFALLHLFNFRLGSTAWAWLPLLVLPQWATGLVLGWMRVRFGIGASIILHACFNAGPMALLWFLQTYAPGALDG